MDGCRVSIGAVTLTTTTIAEVGINHNGYLASAIDLINLAMDAGCTCVKFQMKVPELSTPKNEWDRPKETPWGTTEPYIEYKRKMEFSLDQYQEIDTHCKRRGIQWTASVWDKPSLDRLMNFDVPFIKIPSAHLTNDNLIEASLSTGKPLMVSTGMSTEEEVDHAVDIIRGTNSSLLHCNAAYPAQQEELQLSLIPYLREKYNMPVGFSSHAVSPFPAIMAIVLGAVAVEFHIARDRSAKGTDMSSSQEFHGAQLIAREAKRFPIVFGEPVKKVWPDEAKARLRLKGY